jgi:hypothetical protein
MRDPRLDALLAWTQRAAAHWASPKNCDRSRRACCGTGPWSGRVELKWNNGRAEGHVNRIKLIKRKMYGRANFDLLRIRVLAGGR